MHKNKLYAKISEKGGLYMRELLKKCLVEFIGAFFLIFTIGCSYFPNGRGAFPPLAIGFVLMVLVYMGGHVSGGHYNPAVSFAAAIRGALKWKDFVPYMLAQFLGGGLAAFLVTYIVAIPPYSNETQYSILPMMICEFLFTFLLCYTVLQTATSKKNAGNSYYGLAIGSVLLVALLATIGTCYGAFNPAVALGLILMGLAQIKLTLWTVLANFLAGAAAAGIYKITEAE